ncbi:MAG: SpoIIE family protein phosphatase [Armatimonadetes bacterium]|nr:SpoIIE family protein phosphatase [Armatimonadota bacterium]
MQQLISKNLGRRIVRRYAVTVAASLVGLAFVAAMQPFVAQRFSTRAYIPIHTVLEFASIVVSFAVFAIGWYGYRQTRNRQDLFIAVAFMAVGLLDFVHTLSYKGMPDFLGANSVGKAAAYWLAARLVGAGALLGAAFIGPAVKRRWVRPTVLVPAAGLICAALIVPISVYGQIASDLMYNPQTGLTPLKVGLEWTVVVLHFAAFLEFGRASGWRSGSVQLLQNALIFAAASEICFTLYRSAYDAYNLLGHIYKVGAYYLVLQALFVSSLRRPYRELSDAKIQLQQSFTRIGEALASGLHKDSTLRLIASLARQILQADFAAIGEVRHGDLIELATTNGSDVTGLCIPVADSIAGESFITGEPLLVGDIQSHPKARPELIRIGVRALISAPILRDGRPVGTVYVGSYKPDRFEPTDADTLTAFARYAAISLANAEHFEREHHIAETLQDVLFPPPRIEFGGFTIAGKYEPAWEEARVGGDFYDYFDLGGGKLGIIIGDVSGKGLNAAVHTAIVKYSYQAYLRQGFGPAEAARRVAGVIETRSLHDHMPENIFITLFCAILDTTTGRLVYANCGHEPPVKLSASEEITALDSTGPILGLKSNLPLLEEEVMLAPGDTLVLYTDGITEARADGVLFGPDGLIETLSECSECPPQELAENVYQRAKEHAQGAIHDDIALIAIRHNLK